MMTIGSAWPSGAIRAIFIIKVCVYLILYYIIAFVAFSAILFVYPNQTSFAFKSSTPAFFSYTIPFSSSNVFNFIAMVLGTWKRTYFRGEELRKKNGN